MNHEIKRIKQKMMDALEEVNDDGVVTGEWVCNEDIPGSDEYFEEWFTVCGEIDNENVYFVGIKKIKI